MARGEMDISHTAFDDLPCNRNVNYIRDLLAATGVLPAYQPLVARIPPWLDDLLAAQPKHRADLVNRFARWHVLRKLHLLGDRVTRAAALHGRAAILTAIKFLTWLDRHDLALSQLTQAVLEVNLVDHPGHGEMLAPFIEWTGRLGVTSQLGIPRPQVELPEVVLSDEHAGTTSKPCSTTPRSASASVSPGCSRCCSLNPCPRLPHARPPDHRPARHGDRYLRHRPHRTSRPSRPGRP